MYLRGWAPYFFAAMSTTHGRRRDAAVVSAAGFPAPAAIFPRTATAAARRAGHAGRVCGLCQRAVDGGLFHHVDPPLRGSRPCRIAAEGKDAGHRPVGGRHRPPDRQSAGRRAELPAADRRTGEGRPAPDRVRATDGRGPGAHRADGQAGAGLRPAARHHPAKHRRRTRPSRPRWKCSAQPRAQHPHPQGAGRRGAGAGRPVHAPGSALQPLHQRPERHAQRRHAHAPHAMPWAARTKTRWARWRST